MKNLIFKLTLAFLVVFSANFSLAQHSKKETDSLLEKEMNFVFLKEIESVF